VSDPGDLSKELSALAKQIANKLSKAKNPVIISGASCGSRSVMKAAANIAWALNQKNKKAGIVLTLPECNSLGLAMMGGSRLDAAFNAVLNGHADTVIVMENDLYRHGSKAVVDDFLKRCKTVIVLDHTTHPTSKKSQFVIPAGTFAESDGTIINNEGRAQRFYQVYESTEVIQESWRWLLYMGIDAGNSKMSQWKNFEDITKSISNDEKLLKGVDTVSLSPKFRMADGQRIPRAPHRYSGRTAMLANINVSEPKPPEDPDSPLSYTMEGSRELPPSSAIPFFWSPGWNSVQSVNKYQEEVGAHLRGGDPGLRLLKPSADVSPNYFGGMPEAFKPSAGHLLAVALHHIFGSDELSRQSKSVAQRVSKPYIMINDGDAKNLKVQEGGMLSFEIEKQVHAFPVKISSDMPVGVAGIPYGIAGCSGLPSMGILKN
jgi:NADH-quinone oxidoreductase subunit G